jgi:hypothetical protein
MDHQIIDAKLKLLVYACKETRNFKKLAVVSFVLTSNLIDEIGLKLGVRKRNKLHKESIFEYMGMINSIFETSIKVPIFRDKLITNVRESELLFIKNRGEIPHAYIKSMFRVYYTLRKLHLPDLNVSVDGEKMVYNTNMNLVSYLYSYENQQKKETSKLKPLLVQRVQEQEFNLQTQLKHKFDPALFEKVIYLSKLKNSLTRKKRNKITLSGPLNENMFYNRSVSTLLNYYLVGLILFGLGGLIVIYYLKFLKGNGGI